MTFKRKGWGYMKTDNGKVDAMRKTLELFLKLNEEQMTLTRGVMTGMILENSRKESEKEKVS